MLLYELGLHLLKMLPKKSGQCLLSKDTTLKYDLTSSKKISILFKVFLQKDRTAFNKHVSFKRYILKIHINICQKISKRRVFFHRYNLLNTGLDLHEDGISHIGIICKRYNLINWVHIFFERR